MIFIRATHDRKVLPFRVCATCKSLPQISSRIRNILRIECQGNHITIHDCIHARISRIGKICIIISNNAFEIPIFLMSCDDVASRFQSFDYFRILIQKGYLPSFGRKCLANKTLSFFSCTNYENRIHIQYLHFLYLSKGFMNFVKLRFNPRRCFQHIFNLRQRRHCQQ